MRRADEASPRVKVKGVARINSLILGTDDTLARSRYGLGGRRSLEEAVEFTGVDLAGRRMVGGNKCGNLEWVTYEGREGRLEESLARPEWDEPTTPKVPPPTKVPPVPRFTTANEMFAGVAGLAALLLLLWGFSMRRQKTARQKS